MDSFSSDSVSAESLASLSDKDKRELQQFLVQESQKARIQQAVHDMTNICFKKCFTPSSMKGSTLASSEESCVKNCVGRFLDGNGSIIGMLERYRSEGGH